MILLVWACSGTPDPTGSPPERSPCAQHVAVTAAGDLAWHPRGKLIATGRAGGGLAVWDADTGAVVWTRSGDQPAQALVWGPQDVLYAALGPKVAAFAPDGQELEQLEVPLKHVAELGWTAAGLAAWGSAPEDPRPGTTSDPRLLYWNGGDPASLTAQRLLLAPDGQLLAGETLRFEQGEGFVESAFSGRPWALALSEGWYGVATGREGVTLRARAGEDTWTKVLDDGGSIQALDLHGDLAVWGATDGRIQVEDLAGGAVSELALARPSAVVEALAFSPDGSQVAALEPGVLRIFPTAPTRPLRGFDDPGELVDAVFVDDTTLLEARRGSLRWWSTSDWTLNEVQELDPSRVHRLALAPEGDRLALGRESGFRLLDPASGRHLDDGVSGAAPYLAFGSAGRLWVGLEGASFVRWTDGSQDDLRLQGGSAPGSWSASGRLATGGDERKPRIWDLARGGATVLDAAPGDFYSLSWAPSGERLYAWMRGDRIWAWEVASGAGALAEQVPDHLERAFGHPGDPWVLDGSEVFGAAREGGGPRAAPAERPVTARGSLLVTIGGDHVLRIWDRESARCVAVLESPG